MSEQTIPAVDEQDQPVVMARIECGCGFRAEGFDEQCNVDAFDNHICYRESQPKEHTWHESFFNFLIVAVLVFGFVALLTGKVPW